MRVCACNIKVQYHLRRLNLGSCKTANWCGINKKGKKKKNSDCGVILLTLFFIHSLGKVRTKRGFHWPPSPLHFRGFKKWLIVDTSNDFQDCGISIVEQSCAFGFWKKIRDPLRGDCRRKMMSGRGQGVCCPSSQQPRRVPPPATWSSR